MSGIGNASFYYNLLLTFLVWLVPLFLTLECPILILFLILILVLILIPILGIWSTIPPSLPQISIDAASLAQASDTIWLLVERVLNHLKWGGAVTVHLPGNIHTYSHTYAQT